MKKIAVIILCFSINLHAVHAQEMPKEVQKAMNWIKKQTKTSKQ